MSSGQHVDMLDKKWHNKRHVIYLEGRKMSQVAGGKGKRVLISVLIGVLLFAIPWFIVFAFVHRAPHVDDYEYPEGYTAEYVSTISSVRSEMGS